MSRHSTEDLLPRANWSVYKLTRMAAKRALELSDGMPKLVKNSPTDKFTTIALEEIRQGKIESQEVVDLRAAATKAAESK